jgi:hypothetical protein
MNQSNLAYNQVRHDGKLSARAGCFKILLCICMLLLSSAFFRERKNCSSPSSRNSGVPAAARADGWRRQTIVVEFVDASKGLLRGRNELVELTAITVAMPIEYLWPVLARGRRPNLGVTRQREQFFFKVRPQVVPLFYQRHTMVHVHVVGVNDQASGAG